MKYYILLFFISFEIYKNQLCEKIKSCYNCTTSNNNCSWFNSCFSPDSEALFSNNSKNIKNQISSYPFITNQYNCILNKNDIETFKELDNETITLSVTSNTLQKVGITDNIDYHIYCLEYDLISNILLSIRCNKKYSKNIIELSLYDNITNSDKIININSGKNRINIKSNYFCIKITYRIDNIIDDIISFEVLKYNNNDNDAKSKNENFLSYIILISSILLITVIIWIFVICYKNKSGIMKEITIINKVKISDLKSKNNDNEDNNDDNHTNNNDNNCDRSNCSELQEKYYQLEKNSFVSHNYETLYSFVHNLHNIEKKDVYLKTIIKTLPSFLIRKEDTDLIGTVCFFCENKIQINEKVCLLNCGHMFHYDCISQQIISNEEYNCLICKENIII